MRRNDENVGSATKTIPVPMYIFWKSVLSEVNRTLVAKYRNQIYISEIFRGTKQNAEIEEVIDDCVMRVNEYFKNRGLRSKYPIEPRCHNVY
jgi:predicted CopG family antitoxin